MAQKSLTVIFLFTLALLSAEYIAILRNRNTVNPRCVAIVIPNNNPDELEALLMYTYNRLKCSFNRNGVLYFIIDDATEEEIKIAKAFCKDHYGAKIISKENLCEIMGDSVYKTARFVLY